jgi:hypothetical protein
MQKLWQIDKTLWESVYGWDQWHGSHYEVSMAYPWLSHQERTFLLQCAWSDDNLLGVVESPDQFGRGWQEPASVDPADANHCYGFLRLANGYLVGCGSYFTSWEKTTWFSLYIPLGHLERLFPVHYPLGDEDEHWISIVDDSLAAVGAQIYRQMPFQVAALGEEVGGFEVQEVLPHLADAPDLLVPEPLFTDHHITPYGKKLGEGIWWTGAAREQRAKKGVV